MLCSIVFSIVQIEKPSSTLLTCASISLAHSMETKQLRDKTKKRKPLQEVSHFYIRDILCFYQFCAD